MKSNKYKIIQKGDSMIDVVIYDGGSQEWDCVEKFLNRLGNRDEFQIIRFKSVDALQQNLDDIHLDAIFLLRTKEMIRDEPRMGFILSEKFSASTLIFIGTERTDISLMYEIPRSYFILERDFIEELMRIFQKLLDYIIVRRKSILIKQGNSRIVVKTNDILYLERQGRYTHVHLNGRFYRVTSSLRDLLFHLPFSFKQCHESYIVNFGKVNAMKRSCFILGTDKEVPISRKYLPKIETAFNEYIVHII